MIPWARRRFSHAGPIEGEILVIYVVFVLGNRIWIQIRIVERCRGDRRRLLALLALLAMFALLTLLSLLALLSLLVLLVPLMLLALLAVPWRFDGVFVRRAVIGDPGGAGIGEPAMKGGKGGGTGKVENSLALEAFLSGPDERIGTRSGGCRGILT